MNQLICDKCKRSNANSKLTVRWKKRDYDSGNGIEETSDPFDYCDECAQKILQKVADENK